MAALNGHKTTVRLTDKNKDRTDAHMKEHGSTLNALINIALDRMFEALIEKKGG